MKALVLAVSLVIGLAGGAAGTLAFQDDGSLPHETAAPRAAPEPAEMTVPNAVGERVLLVWTPRGLPVGLDTAVAGLAGVRTDVVVRGDAIDLVRSLDGNGQVVDEPSPGWFIPLDAVALDPTTYATVAPSADRPTVLALGPGEALLGDTSARLRRLGPGGRLELVGGAQVVVAGVVPDETLGGAELAVDVATGQQIDVTTPRALLVAYTGDRAAVETAIAQAVSPGTPIRFRSPGETPFLRAGDAVLPQVLLKDVFGEFAYRPVSSPDGRAVELDSEWVETNIETAELPILGEIRGHRAVLDTLADAMRELEQAGLASTIETFDGCWVPRVIRPGAGLSHHAWGVAIDVNYGRNPTTTLSSQDPRLVEILERHGFAWGGGWLVPDPAHFEYVRPPSR